MTDRPSREPELVEQAEFDAQIDYYVEAAEREQEFLLVRDGIAVCHLGPADC